MAGMGGDGCPWIQSGALQKSQAFPPYWTGPEIRKPPLFPGIPVKYVKSADRAADGEWVKKFLLPLMAVNYLGFLTQYYYLIFLFFMAVGFCLWNLLHCVGKDKGSPQNRR